MSLSLDGRLPSGRRAALLRHVAACTRCRGVWSEMRTAQELALQAPVARVRSDFREGLQHRIESGEAAPEAIYNDPVPAAVRVRQAVTGAAAAALFLIGYHVARESDPVGEAPAEVAVTPSVDFDALPRVPAPAVAADVPAPSSPAQAGPRTLWGSPPAGALAGGSGSSDVQPAGLSWQELNEYQLALAGVAHASSRAQRLRARLRGVSETEQLQRYWPRMQQEARELNAAVGLIRFMEKREMVRIDAPLRDQLMQAERFTRQALDGRRWEERYSALRALQAVSFEQLQSRINVACCEPRQWVCELSDLVIAVPEVRRLLNITVVDRAQMGVEPREQRVFLIAVEQR